MGLLTPLPVDQDCVDDDPDEVSVLVVLVVPADDVPASAAPHATVSPSVEASTPEIRTLRVRSEVRRGAGVLLMPSRSPASLWGGCALHVGRP